VGIVFASGIGYWLTSLVVRARQPPTMDIFVAINVLLPLAAAVLALAFPRFRTALVGAVLLNAAFVLTRLLFIDPRFWGWTPGSVLNRISPFHVAATIGCMAVGGFVVAVVRPWRRVGLADEHLRCACGYLLTGIESPTCPECNAPIDPRTISRKA
jgi:hypothetical protein